MRSTGQLKDVRKLQSQAIPAGKGVKEAKPPISKCHGSLLYDREIPSDTAYQAPVVSLCYNNRKHHFVTSDNNCLRIFEGRRQEPIKVLQLPKDSTTTHLRYNYLHDVYYAIESSIAIKVYSARQGHLLNELCHRDTQDRSVVAMEYYVKEQSIVTAAIDGTLQMWDTDPMPSDRNATGRRYEIERGEAFKDPVAASKSKWISQMYIDERFGRLFCVMDVDVIVWDIDHKKVIYRLCELHDLPITSFAFYPGHQYAITASMDRTIKVWAFEDRERIHLVEVLLGHARGVTAVLLHPESGSLLSCGEDGTVKRWSIDKGDCWDSMQVVGFSGVRSECDGWIDGDTMPGDLHFFSSLPKEGQQLACVVGHSVVLLEFHTHGRALVEAPDTITRFQVIHDVPAGLVSDGGSEAPKKMGRRGGGRPSSRGEPKFPPRASNSTEPGDEKQVLVVSKAGTVEFVGATLGHGSKVIAPSAPEVRKGQGVQVYNITAVMLAGQTNRLFVGWDMGNVDVYDLRQAKRLYTLPIADADPTPVTCICHAELSPHTSMDVAGFGHSKQAARMKAAMIGSIWHSNAGKNIVVVGSESGRLVLTYFQWDVKRKRNVHAHTGGVMHIEYVQGRRQLLTAGTRDGKIKLWDLRSRALFSLAATLQCGNPLVTCVAVRDLGEEVAAQVVAGFEDGGIEVWDTSGSVIAALQWGDVGEQEEAEAEALLDKEQDARRASATALVRDSMTGAGAGAGEGEGEVEKRVSEMLVETEGTLGRDQLERRLGGKKISPQPSSVSTGLTKRSSSSLHLLKPKPPQPRRPKMSEGGVAVPGGGGAGGGAAGARAAPRAAALQRRASMAAARAPPPPPTASPTPTVGDRTMANERAAVGGQVVATTPLQVLEFHKGPVRSVCASEDGRLMASSGDDGLVILWDARPGRDVAVSGFVRFRHPITQVTQISSDFDLMLSSGRHLGVLSTIHLHPVPDEEPEEFRYESSASRYKDLKPWAWENPTRIQRVQFMEPNSMEARELELRLNEVKAMGSIDGMMKGGHMLSAKKMRELEEGMPEAVYRERRREMALRNGEALPPELQPFSSSKPDAGGGGGGGRGGVRPSVPTLKLGAMRRGETGPSSTSRLVYTETEVDHLNKSMVIPNTARPAVRTALSAASGRVVHSSMYWAELMKAAPPELPSARSRKVPAGDGPAHAPAPPPGAGPKKTPRRGRKGKGKKGRRRKDEKINPAWNLVIQQVELPGWKTVTSGSHGRETIIG